jgi:hypothetical protein
VHVVVVHPDHVLVLKNHDCLVYHLLDPHPIIVELHLNLLLIVLVIDLEGREVGQVGAASVVGRTHLAFTVLFMIVL